MMRALIMGALLAGSALAQPASRAPWITGDELVSLFERTSGAKDRFTATAREQLRQYQGEAYLNGVHDATEGKSWCYSERDRPHQDELWADALWGLRALPAAQRKRNAAELVVEIWRRKWPCGSKP